MVIILMYHSISKLGHEYTYSTPVNCFEKQVEYLKNKFEIISLDQFHQLLENDANKLNKGNFAIITFDDGLSDNYSDAWPIIKKHNIPATIFVTTGFIGKTIKNSKGFELSYMNEDQLKELSKDKLITIGSHTDTHLVLRDQITSVVENELRSSKNKLESICGYKIKYFSFPKAKFDQLSKDAAAKEYALGFGGVGALFCMDKIDKFAIPRLIISKQSFFKFRVLTNKLFLFARYILKLI
jgi:peptidoglycan/xylan/chitin deacetylase (PgdA/CDA1 family)